MLSVVLDHTLQHWIGGTVQETILYNWIFLSQMPIFMFVSGYFTINGIYREMTFTRLKEKIIKTVCSLLVPFITYGIISSIIAEELIVIKMFFYPQKSLWFLWALMWMQIFIAISQFLSNMIAKKMFLKFLYSVLGFGVCLSCIVLLYMIYPDKFDSKLIIFYSLFFMFGYFYSFLRKQFKRMDTDTFKIMCIILSLIIVVITMIKHPCIIFERESIKNIIWRLVGSAAAVIFMVNLFFYLSMISISTKIAVFGTISLEMYYIHLILLQIPLVIDPVGNAIMFIIKYCILVIVAILIIFLIKSNKITNMIIFGKVSQKKYKNY